MQKLLFSIIFLSLVLPMGASLASTNKTSRIQEVINADTTERLENIHYLKHSLKDLNRQLAVLNTALEDAQKKTSYKKYYERTIEFFICIY